MKSEVHLWLIFGDISTRHLLANTVTIYATLIVLVYDSSQVMT